MRTWLIALTVTAGATAFMAIADPLPPDASYRPLPTEPLDIVRRNDEAAKAAVMRRQQDLLNERCDVSNRPLSGVMTSGGRKAVARRRACEATSGNAISSASRPQPGVEFVAPLRSRSCPAYQSRAELRSGRSRAADSSACGR